MPYPADDLYPSDSLYPGPGGATISRVREGARLGLSVEVSASSGRNFRWARDAWEAEQVPSGIGFSTTIPGGFESAGLTLRRRPKIGYPDLAEFNNIRITGAGGVLAWEGRLEGAPRSSGDDMAVTPNAVGWQAALEDNQTAVMAYVDRDLSHWQEQTAARRVALYTTFGGLIYDVMAGYTVESDDDAPTIRLNLDGRFAVGAASEAWYDSRAALSSVYYTWTGRNLAAGDVGGVNGTDDTSATSYTSGTDVVTAASGTGNRSETSVDGYRYAYAYLVRAASASATDTDRDLRLSNVAVYGDHGLTKAGAEPEAGFYASDVIRHAVSTWAPTLETNVDQSDFIIPHIAFLDYTTAAEIVREANRFHLYDWAVWDDKTFHYYQPGNRGRRWRTRIGLANLQEAGPQVDKMWNGVLVSYPDVDGTTRTVGPTASTADATSEHLVDTDPAHPANQAGLRRWTQIAVSSPTTVAGAIEIGRRFLIQSRQLNTSGQATITGVCEDDHGVRRPAWQVRAGDYISFTDAADTSPRRIVRTSYDADTLVNSIDLDAPPEGLDALLERLSVSLIRLDL